ncbi:hypothetical protein CE457_01080 [Vreelandella boliviensis LC1]|nr:hypothetical protein CE457_01080 [Halomonas boliviensis LC1]
MKIPEFNFWPYMIVAMGGSYIAFMLVGGLVSDNVESIVGISGFLIAGSWSYLSIETNKEVRVRDEVLGFLKEYEDSVVNYINACDGFVASYHKSFYFHARMKFFINELNSELKNISKEDIEKRLNFIKDNYGVEKVSLLDEDMILNQNKCLTSYNIVLIKGLVLKNHIANKKLIDDARCLCKNLIDGIAETVDYAQKNADGIECKIEQENKTNLLKVLSATLEEKEKTLM